jgi:hypothetical protein
MCQIIFNLISLAVGAVVTFLVTKKYYIKSAKELKHVSSKLDDRMRCMLIAMENANLAELQIDDKGNIIGVEFTFWQKETLEVTK